MKNKRHLPGDHVDQRLPVAAPAPVSASTATSTHAPTPELAYAGIDVTPDERKSWGIIEID